jgi:hypothetical protein
MFHRLSILMILASWSFAWFSASVHVHHPGHDCHHDVAESVSHSHAHSHSHSHSSGAHSHCHDHGKTAHRHPEPSDSTRTDGSENLPVATGDCPLCDLIALELAASQAAEVARAETLISTAPMLRATAPASAARYTLRGRAPPIC